MFEISSATYTTQGSANNNEGSLSDNYSLVASATVEHPVFMDEQPSPSDHFGYEEPQKEVGTLDNESKHHYSSSNGSAVDSLAARTRGRLNKLEASSSCFANAPVNREPSVPATGDNVTGFDDEESSSDGALATLHASIVSAIDDCRTRLGLNVPDNLVAEIEGLSAMILALCDTTSIKGAISIVFLYARRFMSSSVTKMALDYFSGITKSLPLEAQADEDPEWLKMMRKLRTDWKSCGSCKLFSELSKLVGFAVAAGLCEASDVTFDVKGFKVFAPTLLEKHITAFGVADAVAETVMFFVEKMYLCFKTGNWTNLFVDDNAAVKLDEQYMQICQDWNLVKSGNLEIVTGKPVHVFDHELETLTAKIKTLYASANGFEKKLFGDKYNNLLTIKNDYITSMISAGVRESPFAIELFGGSSQGKTTFGDQMTDALLTSAGLPTDAHYRAPFNPEEEFMSTWTTSKLVMQIDDLCNTKSNFVAKPPTQAIINVCNNQPFVANMADLSMKGKVSVQPKLVVVSTNVKDLDARLYSNCPYSIQRRMHYVIVVEAKREFQRIDDQGNAQGLDPEKVKAWKDANPDALFDDIWHLSVERAVQPERLDVQANYAPVTYRGKSLARVSIGVVLAFLCEEFNKHLSIQSSIVKSKTARKNITLCGVDGCRKIHGYCDEHLIDEQIGVEMHALARYLSTFARHVVRFMPRLDFGLSSRYGNRFACIETVRQFQLYWRIASWVPHNGSTMDLLASLLIFQTFGLLRAQYIAISLINVVIPFVIGFISSLAVGWTYGIFIFVNFMCLAFWIQCNLVAVIRGRLRNEILQTVSLSNIMNSWRERQKGLLLACLGSIGILYTLSKMYRTWSKVNSEQGSLAPKTKSDIVARDEQINPWSRVTPRVLPLSKQSSTTTPAQLLKNVENNLVYGQLHMPDGTNKMVNCLFIKSNLVVLPAHYFKHGPLLNFTFKKENPDSCAGSFAARIHTQTSYIIPDTDLAICYVTTGGSFKDLTRWLPMGDIQNGGFHLVWRGLDGTLTRATGMGRAGMATNGRPFKGYNYVNLTINTFNGLCGAVLVSSGPGALISGFHVGGIADTPRGCSCTLTLEMVEKAIEHLRGVDSVLLTGSAEFFEQVVFDKVIVQEGDLHEKSPLNYMPESSQISYHGRCLGAVTSKSCATVTLISEHVAEVTGVPNKYKPPKMNPQWWPWQQCLAKMSIPGIPFEPNEVAFAARDYKSALIDVFRSGLWNDACPLSYTQNMMGIAGQKFMDAVKLGTSIGFPLTGPKREYVDEFVDDDGNVLREFDATINAEIERCEGCYAAGERAFPVAKACCKDEIVSKDKCRIFFSNPIALTFLVRKYFLPILRVLQMNPLLSECAVGINCFGPEWQEFHEHVTKHGDKHLIGGDYGKYDQKLPSQLLLAALRVLIDFARECRYSDQDIKIMEAMAGDIVYAVIAFNGDLISLTEGSHISGNSLTTILNGIVGSLNLRLVFYKLYPAESFETRIPFREAAAIMTYGDDNTGSVDPKYSKFNIKSISETLEKYGQEYTMPDKTSELVEFLPREDFEFLKRKSVFIPELGMHIGALVDDSIFKMLHYYMREKSSPHSPEVACAMNIDTALSEWFNHGREVYEFRRGQMNEIAKRANLDGFCTLLNSDYDTLVLEWKRKYDPAFAELPETFTYDVQSGNEAIADLYKTASSDAVLSAERSKTAYHHWLPYDKTCKGKCELSNGFDDGGKALFSEALPAKQISRPHSLSVPWERRSSLTENRKKTHRGKRKNKPQTQRKAEQADKALIKSTGGWHVGVCPTCGNLSKRCECWSKSVMQQQDGDESDKSVYLGSDTMKSENITFHDQQSAYVTDVDSIIDPTRNAGASQDLDMNKFLERPIKIATYSWGVGTSLTQTFKPWDLFLNNPRVANRICNYFLLRGKLHVKFVLNGNGFYYGRAMAIYHPMASSDQSTVISSLSDLVQGSQMPHVFLNPTMSTGGEIVCPFFWYRNSLRIVTDEMDEMGDIYIRTLQPLKHANGGVTNISVNVFAYMTDVELDVLTSVDHFNLQPQDGDEVDQANSKGIVSGPATAIAEYAKYFMKIPYIAPFAMATKEVASATAAVAKIFGYSRPNTTCDSAPVKPAIVSSLALTTVPDGSQKMTIDDKQELSIDPRIAGLGGADPLSIASIASRESFLTKFTWQTNQPPDELLWNCRVQPGLWNEDGNPKYLNLTALAAASMPFDYWTGTLKFRFQVVCSSFHKGRIRVVYDPMFMQHNEYNVNTMQICDIAMDQDFTVSIGNGQDRTWLTHFVPGRDSVTQAYSTTTYTTNDVGNGVLSVYVMNELTAPAAVENDVEINVFVSAGEDFAVAAPCEQIAYYTFKPQDGLEIMQPQDGDERVADSNRTKEQDAPIQKKSYPLGPGLQNMTNTHAVFMGEQIASFRPLLKRYNLHSAMGGGSATGDIVYFGRRPAFPFYRGNVPGAVDLTAGLLPYNYCNTVLLHWITQCFSAWRGSIRWKVVPRGNSPSDATVQVQRETLIGPTFTKYDDRVIKLPTHTVYERAKATVLPVAGATPFSDNIPRSLLGMKGMVTGQARLNKALEFEVPYYSDVRFQPGKRLDITGNNNYKIPVYDYRIEQPRTDTTTVYDLYVAAGEDFQTYFWTGLPRIYYEATYPATP